MKTHIDIQFLNAKLEFEINDCGENKRRLLVLVVELLILVIYNYTKINLNK